MGKDKGGRTASSCASCGTGTTCSNCGGSGHWYSNPDVKCSHCVGRGRCPING